MPFVTGKGGNSDWQEEFSSDYLSSKCNPLAGHPHSWLGFVSEYLLSKCTIYVTQMSQVHVDKRFFSSQSVLENSNYFEEEDKCISINEINCFVCRHLPRRYKKLNIKSRPDSEGGDSSTITAYTRYSFHVFTYFVLWFEEQWQNGYYTPTNSISRRFRLHLLLKVVHRNPLFKTTVKKIN